jgi:predicted nucleic acid-binding Zn ribbon protein
VTRPPKSQPVSIGSLVSQVLEDIGAGHSARVSRIAQRWEEAVGREIAQHCRPTGLRGDVLEMTVDSSVWCQQLQLRGPEILEALCAVLPADAPSELWFRVGRDRSGP